MSLRGVPEVTLCTGPYLRLLAVGDVQGKGHRMQTVLGYLEENVCQQTLHPYDGSPVTFIRVWVKRAKKVKS